VALIVYSDYECQFCKHFAHETLPQLEEDFIRPGLIRFYFKNFPLTAIHKLAFLSAEASACAAAQGQFRKMHDWLFGLSTPVTMVALSDAIGSMRLDRGAFQRCMTGELAERVRKEAAEGRALGVTGTPTFFIGRALADGRVQPGARVVGDSFPQLRAALTIALHPAAPTDFVTWAVATLAVLAVPATMMLRRLGRPSSPRVRYHSDS
jgi:protein-disulfide isomerase